MAKARDQSQKCNIPLREWIEGEPKDVQIPTIDQVRRKNVMLLGKVTVAYGISELLKHRCLTARQGDVDNLTEAEYSIDNFAVRLSVSTGREPPSSSSHYPVVDGVDMISPAVSLKITEPSFLKGSYYPLLYDSTDQEGGDEMGKYLEVEVLENEESVGAKLSSANSSCQYDVDESSKLHSFGKLLYELFSQFDTSKIDFLHGLRARNGNVAQDGKDGNTGESGGVFQEPVRKKRALSSTDNGTAADNGAGPHNISQLYLSQYIPLQELGYPSSLSMLVHNLLECGLDSTERPPDAYDSLQTSSSDLHLLLLEPERFLFGVHDSIGRGRALSNDGKVPLQFRKEKLYGRETEVSQIQEAFCRVSSGQSEAFFIGGYSGSGKTRLVESLRAQVDVAGGYVVTRKFDQISKERPLLEVVSAFNHLCHLIKEKNTPQELSVIANLLMEAFGSDSVLARILPNVSLIAPQLKISPAHYNNNSDQMNIQSVGFVLRRFMRVVSSQSHPVMLFLDDLQWSSDSSALTVIKSILMDKEGESSSCLFFVGSYRSNEVQHQADHAIHRFMDNLDRSGVPSTKLSLFGINYNDLNSMISDAMGLFPRLCEPLVDIIFQKTKGNPFFLLECIKSLVERDLVQYSPRKRRWVWDEIAIKSMDITDNVLFLLTNKMSQLPERIQSVLKVVSCFGSTIYASVVGLLSSTSEYSNIKECLEELVWESFIVAVAGDFKFVHDKVREAAYRLISDEEEVKFHESLGLVLYSVSNKGQELGEALLPVVDQINRGLPLVHTQAMRIDIAKLNLKAGVQCFDRSDYDTAGFYLDRTLSLVPTDHWKTEYKLSLRIYFLLARSANSCGNSDKAFASVRSILQEGHCIEDKLDAYFLLVNVYQAREEAEDAYMTCLEVLSQLGEDVPAYCDGKDAFKMVEDTSNYLLCKSDEELMSIKSDESSLNPAIIKFYSSMTIVSFFVKPEVVPFLGCRMIELSLAHGITKYSLLGFIEFATCRCQMSSLMKDIQDICKIGKRAHHLMTRFECSDTIARAHFLYYGHVAYYIEPIQSCSEMTKRGFETGMSNGDTFSAFCSAIHHMRLSIIGGSKLPTILQQCDYYLNVVRQHDNYLSKKYLLVLQETIAILIDKDSSIEKGDREKELSESLCMKRLSETVNFHKALQSFWLGYAERCHHYVQKLLQMLDCGRQHRLIMTFYNGINSFRLLRRQRTTKLRQISRDAIASMKTAAQHSKWNYGNKVHLLEAELYSFDGKHEEAKSSYTAAILSSRSSGFVHEQGLACELAGFHYKKIGDLHRAWGFFNQARICYFEWGSHMKVDSISRQLENPGS